RDPDLGKVVLYQLSYSRPEYCFQPKCGCFLCTESVHADLRILHRYGVRIIREIRFVASP
ncbi:hypothetical protein, partial [Yersinia massiliensis]|uniref:hypothetical protein n=1 Tax=Yersinia massiliensis TaxID=419257 RepID=UPI0028D72674